MKGNISLNEEFNKGKHDNQSRVLVKLNVILFLLKIKKQIYSSAQKYV